MKIGESNIVQN